MFVTNEEEVGSVLTVVGMFPCSRNASSCGRQEMLVKVSEQ